MIILYYLHIHVPKHMYLCYRVNFPVFVIVHTQNQPLKMGRKFRLGVHRKNDERYKLLAKKANIGPGTLVVSINLERISVFKVSLPIDYLLQAKALSLPVLRQCIQATCILPQGLLVMQCLVTCSSSHTFNYCSLCVVLFVI